MTLLGSQRTLKQSQVSQELVFLGRPRYDLSIMAKRSEEADEEEGGGSHSDAHSYMGHSSPSCSAY